MFNVFNKFFKKMNLPKMNMPKMTMPKMTMPKMKHHYWLLTLFIILLLAIALGSFFKNLIEGFDNSKTPIYLPKKIYDKIVDIYTLTELKKIKSVYIVKELKRINNYNTFTVEV